MRKRVISPAPKEVTSPDPKWLDVEQLARVEVTSEDAAHPIEAALVPGEEAGGRPPARRADHPFAGLSAAVFLAAFHKAHA